MNLEDRAREAAADVKQSARTVPVPALPSAKSNRWMALVFMGAAFLAAVGTLGVFSGDPPLPSTTTTPEVVSVPTTTSTMPTTTAPATTTTSIPFDYGPRLAAPPPEPHIQLTLFSDRTLIVGMDGTVVGHIEPSLVEPEFYQTRHRRLTAEVAASHLVPEGCVVDEVLEPGASWRVVCHSSDGFDPTIGVLAADGSIEVIARIPTPAGQPVIGHWRDVFVRADGAILAQFSGECEVADAMFVIDGEARHIDGSAYVDERPVPSSHTYGWLPDGRALIWTYSDAACGIADSVPGVYAYAMDGDRELLLTWPDPHRPVWGRIVGSAPAGVSAQRWLRGVYSVGVFGSDGDQLIADRLSSGGGKRVAWDGSSGFVYVREDRSLSWWTPDGEVEVTPISWNTYLELVDVLVLDSQVLVVNRDGALIAVDLATGETHGPPQRIRSVESGQLALTQAGRTAQIHWPDWDDIPRGEDGGPIPPFPLMELVVTGPTESLRFELGSFERPFAILHDFDGRRVIVSVEAHEPAMAPRTVYVIDLECATCTEIIDTDGPDSFDLVGVLQSLGPMVSPQVP